MGGLSYAWLGEVLFRKTGWTDGQVLCFQREDSKSAAWLTALKPVSDAPGDLCPIPKGAKRDQPHIPLMHLSHCVEPIYFVFI